MSSDWGRRMKSGLLWALVGYGLGRASTLITTIVIARVLLPSQFGIAAAVLVFIALIELGSDLGMNATVIYEQQSHDERRLDVAFTVNLLFALLLAGGGFFLATPIAGLFGMHSHVGLFRLAPLDLVLVALGNIHDAVLMREMDFRQRVKPMVTRSLVRGSVSIALALVGLGAASIVIGALAASACWTIAQWRITAYRPRLSLNRRIAASMASYGGAAAALEVLAVIGGRIDQVVVGRILGPLALGLYTIAFRIPESAVDTVFWTVSIVAFPGLARQRVIDERGLGTAATMVMRYQALYALPVSAGLAVMASPLVVTLFGAKWSGAGAVMSAVCVMSALSGIVAPLGDVFKALGRQRVLVILGLLQFPVFIGLMVLAAGGGIVAVAWVRAGAQVLNAGPMMIMLMRAAHVPGREVLRSLRPGVAGMLGVVTGAGVVRLAWPALAVGPLVLGTIAAMVVGAGALRLLAPGTLSELWAQLPLPSRRPTPVVG